MRRCIFALALTAVLACAGPARATILNPGGSVTPPPTVTSYSGTFVTQVTGIFTLGAPGANQIVGKVIEDVYRETNGNLDFLYQVQVTKAGNNKLTSLGAQNFPSNDVRGGLMIDVSQLKNGTTIAGSGFGNGVPFSNNSNPGTSAYQATRSAGLGDTNNFSFEMLHGVGKGQNSWVMIVRTNDTKYDLHGSVIPGYGGGSVTLPNFAEPAPAPEPGTLVLWGGMFLGAAGLTFWQRRRAAAVTC